MKSLKELDIKNQLLDEVYDDFCNIIDIPERKKTRISFTIPKWVFKSIAFSLTIVTIGIIYSLSFYFGYLFNTDCTNPITDKLGMYLLLPVMGFFFLLFGGALVVLVGCGILNISYYNIYRPILEYLFNEPKETRLKI